jgi:integrase
LHFDPFCPVLSLFLGNVTDINQCVVRANFKLDAAGRADAREAMRILEGSGLSLAEAARIATGRSAAVMRTALDVAVDAFLAGCLERNLRGRSVDFYEFNLRAFSEAHAGACLDDFARPDLAAWLLAQKRGPSLATPKAFLRAIRALFRWARRQDPPLCMADPTEGLLVQERREAREVGVFSPVEAGLILGAAGSATAAAALMLFAGVRPSEINARDKPPLLWRCVDFEGRVIRIPAEIAKTRVTRILEDLPDNLWAWLLRCRGEPEERVCNGQALLVGRRGRAAVGRWPQDGCRHSFATYHVARFGSADRTSLILGHEGRVSLLHQRYRGLCTQAEARAFFELVPEGG